MDVEIELRARFDQAKYDELLQFLKTHAQDLGVNDKRLYLYLLPAKLLKVVENTTKQTAKISLKVNRIGQGVAFPETELEIPFAEVAKAVEIFTSLGFTEMHTADNRRHDFRYQEVEIALKYSEAWGHHAEFEVLLSNPTEEDRVSAVDRIHRVAESLGVSLMSEEELATFTREFEQAQK